MTFFLLIAAALGLSFWLGLQFAFDSGIAASGQRALEGLGGRLASALRASGAKVARAEMLLLASAACGAAILFALTESWLGLLFGASLGFAAPWAWASRLKTQHDELFGRQLPGALDLISGGLRAGLSLPQALQAAALESPQPLDGHFKEVASALGLGETPEKALDQLALSLGDADCAEELRMLATAVAVTRSSGGNLSEILSRLAETLRERQRLKAEVDAMTAQGRLSGWIVGGLPILLLFALHLIDPDLVEPMFHTPLGLGLLGLGIVLELAGFYLIRRIVDVKE